MRGLCLVGANPDAQLQEIKNHLGLEDQLRAHSLRVAGKAIASTRREPADYRPAISNEELDEIVERSRQEHLAARKAEAEAETEAGEDEAARRQRTINLALPRRAITFNGQRWRELPLGTEQVATPEQIAEREERLARNRAAARAAEEARQRRLKEAEPVVNIAGVRVRARDGVIVDPKR